MKVRNVGIFWSPLAIFITGSSPRRSSKPTKQSKAKQSSVTDLPGVGGR